MTARPQDHFRTTYDQRQNILFDRLAQRPYGPAFPLDCTIHPCPGNMGPYTTEQYEEDYTRLGGPNPWKWRTSYDRRSLALYNNLARPAYGPAVPPDCTIRPCPGDMGAYTEQYEGFCGSCGGAAYSGGNDVGMWGMNANIKKKAQLM